MPLMVALFRGSFAPTGRAGLFLELIRTYREKDAEGSFAPTGRAGLLPLSYPLCRQSPLVFNGGGGKGIDPGVEPRRRSTYEGRSATS
ncbi:MAG: hypothetical protein ACUVSI_02280 [Actinomycetota bacterium]